MHLAITGSTGFAGGEVLRQALLDPTIDRVTSIVRRASSTTHAKLHEIVLADFRDYHSVDFAAIDAVIWALGVSQTAVSEAEYISITHDYTVAAATAYFAARPDGRFVFVSGQKADPEGTRGSLNRRIKGRTETSLRALSPNVFVFRPGWIRPTKITGNRTDSAGKFTWLVRLLAPIWPGFTAVDCDRLASSLLRVAARGGTERVLDNAAI